VNSMSTTNEPFRTFCAEIAKTEDFRVYCNDWTAIEIALERYLKRSFMMKLTKNKLRDMVEQALALVIGEYLKKIENEFDRIEVKLVR